MKKILAAIGITLLGLGVYGAAQAFASPQSKLEALGKELHLSAAQQPQFQAIVDASASARALSLQQADQRISQALAALKTPGADLSTLARQMPDPNSPAAQARQHVREMMITFYADATPAQQAQIRDFLSARLTRAQGLLHRRIDAMTEAG